MSGELKVYLVGFWPDYESFFFNNLSIKGISFKTINPLEIINNNILKKNLPRYIKNKLFKKIIVEVILNNSDSIFFFQEHRLIMELLLESDFECEGHLLLRNSVRSESKTIDYIKQFEVKNYTVWSFDESDCNSYGLKFYKQIIESYKDISSTTILYDFSFVGRNKGREKYLLSLKADLCKNGLSMNVNIRGSSKKDSISYRQYLSESCQARCIVDIVQDQQSGFTLRPLEAMLYRRKLITNNASVKGSSFFHPNNIYILYDLDAPVEIDRIKEFIEKPFIDVSEKVREDYSVNSVFERMIKIK